MASFFERSLGITAHPKHDPVQWNIQWEQMMSKLLTPAAMHQFLQLSEASVTGEEILSNHRKRIQDLCTQQRNLTINTASCFALHDFEAKWLKTDKLVRQKHLLEGIVRTCAITSGMEDSRLCCEEITLANLQARNGQEFLDLLSFFMVKDTSSTPTTPILLCNPRWDKMIGKHRKNLSERDKIFHAYYDGVRNVFICKPYCNVQDLVRTY
jgi:hypothetical protein